MKIEIGKVINLIKYHAEEGEEDFRLLAEEIAHGLIEDGHGELGRYILAQLSPQDTLSPGGGLVERKKEIDLNKTFYVIVRYWAGNIEGFVTVGDDKEEIIKIFEERYMITQENSWGVTEASHKLLEVNAKEILNDMSRIERSKK